MSARDPKGALEVACRNLENFAEQFSKGTLPFLLKLKVDDNRLLTAQKKSSIDLIKQLFSKKRRTEQKLRSEQIQHAVHQTIDTIKRNHLILEKLKSGSIEEQNIAQSTLKAIQKFNAVLLKKKRDSSYFLRWIHKLLKYIGISMGGNLQYIELPFLQSCQLPSQQTIVHVVENSLEVDALRLKASMLLKQHGIPFKTTSESLKLLKNAPIEVQYDATNAISTLSLNVPLLPRTHVKVKGSFKKTDNTNQIIPIPESFQLSFNALERGFPDATQYCGWALDNFLLPIHIQYPERVPEVQKLLYQQRIVETGLKPGGILIQHAQELWKLKKECMEENKESILELLQQLFLAMEVDVSRFFKEIRSSMNALEMLTRGISQFNQKCIVGGYQALEKAWTERTVSELFHFNQTVVAKAAENLLNAFQKEMLFQMSTSSLEYLFCEVLSPSINKILMQYFSESLQIMPPKLGLVEKKLQISAFRQLNTFLKELLSPSDCSKNDLFDRIDQDIILFKASTERDLPSFELALINSLEQYYLQRQQA